MKTTDTQSTETPELKTGEMTEQEKAEYHQQLANELADVMQEGIYPMDIVNFMWDVLELALKRQDISFNHFGYTKAVIPYLLAVNSEYEETVICMTATLRDLQQNKKLIKAEPNVLDLSAHPTAENECIDLAKHLSAVLKDKHIPDNLLAVIKGELSTDDLSPEKLAEILCQEK